MLTPFVKNIDMTIKIMVNNNPKMPKIIKSSSLLPVRKGATMPAESQATAAFVKNSAKAFFCPTDNLSIFKV